MTKEKIGNNLDSYERYQEKIKLIKKLVQEINEEFGLNQFRYSKVKKRILKKL